MTNQTREQEHDKNCRWERTTEQECEYRATHHYCPHPEHACNCSAFEPKNHLSPSGKEQARLYAGLWKPASEVSHHTFVIPEEHKQSLNKYIDLVVSQALATTREEAVTEFAEFAKKKFRSSFSTNHSGTLDQALQAFLKEQGENERG